MTRQLLILMVSVSFAMESSRGADGGPAWVAKDVGVLMTVPGQDGAANTRLEVGANGDARITVDMREGKDHTKGTIVLIAGRWMLTQGFAPTPGAEIDEMDIAALNSQLVMRLLSAALPKGPPAPGLLHHASYNEKAIPMQVATSSASAEYRAPWSVSGTVAVRAAGAPAAYKLKFTYSDKGHAIIMNLAGNIADPDTVVSFPDSMTLSGWTIHNIGPYQQQYPGGTTLDFGARPETPKAATVGELRKLTNSDSR
jgi:hypothetical protein